MPAVTLTELTRLFEHATTSLLLTASDRVGAPFLLGALLIASVVWWRRVRGKTSLLAFLFPKSIWWHASARLDYALLITRVLLDVVVLSSLAVSTTAITFAVARGLWRTVGILEDVHVSTALVTAVFSITAFLAEDLARYGVHRLAHRVPAFWELHKLHHSAQVLTPFTIFRVHPIEGLLNAGAAALAVGVVGGVITWIAPGKLNAWTISGIYALQYLWNVLGTNLRHSHVWISYGRYLEHVLISPAQHQIHHSNAQRHFDRNFGSALALWDWLFGTLYVTHGREQLTFGLSDSELNHRPQLISALWSTLRAALLRLTQPNHKAADAQQRHSQAEERDQHAVPKTTDRREMQVREPA